MSHLSPQPEDNDDVLAAKKYIAGDLIVGRLDLRRLLIAVLDDRSDWIIKTAEARDTMIDVVAQFTPCNDYERELISLMAGQAREMSAMLNPPQDKVIAFGQR